MNLASSEFPLRTNNELNQILSIYNGSNEVEIITTYSNFRSRVEYSWVENRTTNSIGNTNKRKSSVPHYNITKGYAYTVLHRDFVDYALNDPRARDFLSWLQDTYSPDEV